MQSDYGVIYDVVPPRTSGSATPCRPIPAAAGPAVPNEVAMGNVTKTPFTRQTSIGISHQVNDWLGVSLDYSNIQYRDLPFRFKGNPRVDGGARRFSDFGNFRIWTGGGKADYDGGVLVQRASLRQAPDAGLHTLSKIEERPRRRGRVPASTAADYQPDLVGGT